MSNTTQATAGNRVIGGYMAIVAGHSTGLAGCADSASCKRSALCLRADVQLQHRVVHGCQSDGRFFIKQGVEAATA